MEKMKTNIKGLDVLLGGGIPVHNNVFICGGPGTGKTSLAMEFLYRGALEGDNGLFLSLEEDTNSLVDNATTTFTKWNKFNQMIKEKKLMVLTQESYIHVDTPETGVSPYYTFNKLQDKINETIEDNKIERIVVDSASILNLFFTDDLEYRRTLLNLLRDLKRKGCTALLTAELQNVNRETVRFAIEHFVADGVILLYLLEQQERRISAMEVLKMRGSEHSKVLTPFKITPNGIEVFVGERVY
ncbi:AAA family ATPase [Candidatus Micrarchaeota archaeon]|nr:AAA family ATPase [Candidatus Micrarchaeota archaeon]